jgi:membrane protease YdiL (CAAX protease family)
MKEDTAPEPLPSSTPAPDPARRTTLYLVLASTVAALLQIPFTTALAPRNAPPGAAMADAAANAAVTVLLSYVMIRVGFRAARRIGFGTFMLAGCDDGEFRPAVARRALLLATGIGVAEGAAVLVGMGIVSPYLPRANVKDPAPWMGLLASVSAGVTEEILFRLGLMTSLAWLLTVLTRRSAAGPVIALVANVLAAFVFAAMHLPQAKAFYGLSTLMVLVVMIGNGVPGVIFGWLFRRFGLIAAMVAHFSADVVLHVIGPMIG